MRSSSKFGPHWIPNRLVGSPRRGRPHPSILYGTSPVPGKALLKDAASPCPPARRRRRPKPGRRRVPRRPVVIKIRPGPPAARDRRRRLRQLADEAASAAERLLKIRVGQFPVTHVLVKRNSRSRASSLFLSVDDKSAPVLLISSGGGSGVEERAASVQRIPCDVRTGPDAASFRAIDASNFRGRRCKPRSSTSQPSSRSPSPRRAVHRDQPARDPRDGSLVAADCRMTIDDYAVFGHPELGIEIARELTTCPPRPNASPTTSNRPTTAAPFTSRR